MDSLFLASCAQAVETFLPLTVANGAIKRSVSPTPGRSMWMTSAPKSANTVAAKGIAMREPLSMILIPAREPNSGMINVRSLMDKILLQSVINLRTKRGPKPSGFPPFDLLDQGRYQRPVVGHRAVVGDVENRSALGMVDADDAAGFLHADLVLDRT